jgi:hypothetical protein
VDAGCARCTKSTRKAPAAKCLACTPDGPVAPELVSGRCFCPAGSARVGTAGTVPVVTASATTPTKKSGGGKKPKVVVKPSACAECAADYFSNSLQPIGTSVCTACPTGTTTNGATGSTACVPALACGTAGTSCGVNAFCNASDECSCDAGLYATAQAPNPVCSQCTPGSYCAGGPIASAVQTPCPLGKDTNCAAGASAVNECVVSTVDPCGGSAAPKTFFTTSTAYAASNAVYVVAALNPPTASTAVPPPAATLVCTMAGSGFFADPTSSIDDVAALSTGKLLLTARATSTSPDGVLILLDPDQQQAAQPCVYTTLLAVTPAIVGIAAGLKSNMFYTTAGSSLTTYMLREAAGGGAELFLLQTIDIAAQQYVSPSFTFGITSDVSVIPYQGQTNIFFTSGNEGQYLDLDENGVISGSVSTTGPMAGGPVPAVWCTRTNNGYFGATTTSTQAYFYGPYFLYYDVGINGISGAATAIACPSS